MMKLKSFILFICLGLSSLGYAENRHIHPKADSQTTSSVAKNAMSPGFCEIEIINDSNQYVTVSGRFDDGAPLSPFNIYAYEIPHYISLYYYNYCHANMSLYITSNGYLLYSGVTNVGSTIHIVPYMKGQLKAEIRTK